MVKIFDWIKGLWNRFIGLFKKVPEVPKEIIPEYEEVTVHFRVDYSGAKARKGHEFYCKDSYVSMKVNKHWSDEKIFDEAENLIKEALGSNFNSQLASETEMVEGIERNTDNGERIFVNYGSSKSAGNKLDISLRDLRYSMKKQGEFLESIGKVR